jgi:N-acetylglutamate synthase-like GNAT family acetyltransferase
MDLDIVIRPARTSDVALMHDLIKTSIEESTQLNAEARRGLSKQYGLTAIHDHTSVDNLISIVAASPNESIQAAALMSIEGGILHVKYLVVPKSMRRHGVGALFTREILKIAKQLSVHRVIGWTRSTDIASQVLASREGFSLLANFPSFWYGQDYMLWQRTL